MRTDYHPAKTLWCFDTTRARVYLITVVAETEKCLYLAPSREYNNLGNKMPPILRHKRALRSFHSFHEAKHELMQELAGQLSARRNANRHSFRARCEELLETASKLEDPHAIKR
jgi:hypothetical protein